MSMTTKKNPTLCPLQTFRDMVKDKRSFLKSIVKGNCPNKAQALTEQEIEILSTNNGFNYHDADCLCSAIWFLLALNFGLRGSHECRQLTVGDLTVREHFNGQRYLELNERVTKTRRGDGNRRAFAPKAWSNGTPRCPVFYIRTVHEQEASSHGPCGQPIFPERKPLAEGQEPHLVCGQANRQKHLGGNFADRSQ